MARRTRKGSDARTRTGCNKCRLRRVKCPEQKPTCASCARFGFDCTYDQKLRWQPTDLLEVQRPELAHVLASQTESWMFLSTFNLDFDRDTAPCSQAAEPESDSESDLSETFLQSGLVQHFSNANRLHAIDHLPLLSNLRLSTTESYLWEYFHQAIAPSCVLNQERNPYRDVFLRIAASTGNSSPLFLSIMAISTSQLVILGGREFRLPSCTYRQKALRSLRIHTNQIEEGHVGNQSTEAQVIATVMAMVFLDILSDCSESWVVHSNFARARIQRLREGMASLDPDLSSLLDFVGGYIVAHEVYAHTAWDIDQGDAVPRGHIASMCDDANLRTLTGCSTEFFQILSDVNTLVADYTEVSQRDFADPEALEILDQRRLVMERQLHSCAVSNATPSQDEHDQPGDVSESPLALEIKRLTALLHMHSRIGHLGPEDRCISELASRILALIARVPEKSNIILWPLFMVGTLGIGPHCDEERLFILSKLEALQRQRQMRYIKKARRIIVDVWKLRDASDANTKVGWRILKDVTREQKISLL